ncbi:MAG: hypothetical protein BJ554DRAFT_3153 [Olpidium bornovanus]|uniref:Uncharacterized protein n=1 Tax=Olpidium bornovanus TaxID=278681 RepID=A0A8H7ZNW0_9FUNG|nr:MAG: hypothetical protein BJ554DRAFT_3153 [Olpidium bornovanus]
MTEYRKRKAKAELAQHAKSYQRVDQMFRRAVAENEDEAVEDKEDNDVGMDEVEKLSAAKKKLRDVLARIKNQKSELAAVSGYQLQHLMCIQRYMALVLGGTKKVKASEQAAKERWTTTTNYAGRCIHAWARTYAQLGKLPEHTQGKHAKRASILDDEDIKAWCVQWLRTCRPQDRSAADLQRELLTVIFPDKLGVEATIAISTVAKFMKLWGFKKRVAGGSKFILMVTSVQTLLPTAKIGQNRCSSTESSWTSILEMTWRSPNHHAYASGKASTCLSRTTGLHST